MDGMTTTRRGFVSGAAALGLSLKYGCSSDTSEQAPTQIYPGWEDLMRNKWTWDRVARGTHGTNCTGNCAFNVYVQNGIVWREEQQGEYGSSGEDTPDYGPRGCQKGLRHAKYMYGKQRLLYPMKRVGERGEGKWERISWDQAMEEIADKFIDYTVEFGPASITQGAGTQAAMKQTVFASMFRFVAATGIEFPEAFAGVGDLPTGIYMTTGVPLICDTMAAVYKSKCCLVWFCNPAVTRIPDAHFFWEARYNGTEVIAISPEFTPSAMHASKWVNPQPGTDAALAMSMVNVILEEGLHDAEFIREQTDLPFLVRTDNRKFLRETDVVGGDEARSNLFYVWDEATGAAAPAPATGQPQPPPGTPVPVQNQGSIELGELMPALEGRFTVDTWSGPVEVTTVFELMKEKAAEYAPDRAVEITSVSPEVVRQIARKFATADPSMIFIGYRVCKWLHGDLIQRAFMLLLAITGNQGKAGSGLQMSNYDFTPQIGFAMKDLPPPRITTTSRWDYTQANHKELTREIYGEELADHVDKYFQESVQRRWFPDFSQTQWKMGLFTGSNAANWRVSGERWRDRGLGQLETIVTMTPDMSATAMYSDYVLPIASHYERKDFMLESRTPYMQVLDEAVPPLGESVDDFTAYQRLAEAISRRATERSIAPVDDNFFGMPIVRDMTKYHDQLTMNGQIQSAVDIAQWLIDNNDGVPSVSFAELADRGIIRVNDSDGTVYGHDSPYDTLLNRSLLDKQAYQTLTARQQFYVDHDWFMEEGESLPTYREPVAVQGYPLRLLMGHARHGIHSMWRDDPLMISLQRGEPDIYVNPDDAAARGVEDGDLIRVFNSSSSFIVMAHVSSMIQPGMTYMYHGWDPMMFRGRQNFGAVISTGGLIKPTSLVGGYGHITYRPFYYEPNATFQDLTCDFEKSEEAA
ncbi:MAG: molybdopterin-dependent oxidoreductase [Acidiferrobacterales bacterium]